MSGVYCDEPKLEVIYIAGPMTGYDNFNYPAFFDAEHIIKSLYNCIVINPARHVTGMNYDYYIKIAMHDVEYSDTIVLLDGWEKSKGVSLEIDKAKEHGKNIIPFCLFINKHIDK